MTAPPRTPNVLLSSTEVSRLTRELLGCGRDAYRVFRKQNIDGNWRAIVKDVLYEEKQGGTVVRGTQKMLSRISSHLLEDIWERELGIIARIETAPDGTRRFAPIAD